MIEVTLIVGSITLAAGGFALAVLLLIAASWACGIYGSKLFRDVTRIYHISVIAYWLGRLEASGVREFQKAEQEDREVQALRSKAWRAKP